MSANDLQHGDLITLSLNDVDVSIPSIGRVTGEKRWKWNEEKVLALLDSLIAYKTEMDFKGLDFQADLVLCYSKIRERMAGNFAVSDFGPQCMPVKDTDSMDTQDLVVYKRKRQQMEKCKKEGYNRIRSKIKELRSGYKLAVDKGSRSGSGKLVCDHFEKLQQIWGGSPSVVTIEGGRASFVDGRASKCGRARDDPTEDVEECRSQIENDDQPSQSFGQSMSCKRAKMEKKMSLHEKEMLQINMYKEELALKKEALNVMKENAKCTHDSIKAMAESMCAIGQSMREGFAMISNSIVQSQQMGSAFNVPNLHQPQQHFFGSFSKASSDSNASSFGQ